MRLNKILSIIVWLLVCVIVRGQSVECKIYKNLCYGPFEKNNFDIYLPDTTTPTPLVIFFHGGGFTGGDKGNLKKQQKILQKLLENKIAFATVNYRFRVNNDSMGVFNCLNDAKLFLQYIRFYAASYNINKGKIGCYGESAGAGISLYLAFHDDMASKDSMNKIARESTRVLCAGALEAQATYNLFRWKKYIEGLPLIFIVKGKQLKADMAGFYGYESYQSFKPYKNKIVKQVDMLKMLSSDDPPIWVKNNMDFGKPKSFNHILHHPEHAVILGKETKKKGLTSYIYTNKAQYSSTEQKELEDFLVEILKK